MDFKIKKEDWKNFLDSLSKRRFEWRTGVEVLNTEVGDQILSDGLLLNGITAETAGDDTTITISLGENVDHHQTHTIKNPIMVTFLANRDNSPEIVAIEEEDGTKTLIRFIEPGRLLLGFVEFEMAAAVA